MSEYITIIGIFFPMGFGGGLGISMILLIQQAMKRAVSAGS